MEGGEGISVWAAAELRASGSGRGGLAAYSCTTVLYTTTLCVTMNSSVRSSMDVKRGQL